MPELPEVETTCRGLQPYLENQSIEWVECRRRDLRWPIDDAFEELLSGQHVQRVHRIGKYMLWTLANDHTVIAHLGMSGTFRVEDHLPDPFRKHDHVIIMLESGQCIIFHDPRRFGFIVFCETKDLLSHPRLHQMGPDPFDATALTPAYLMQIFSRRKGPIKPALLNQSLIAGIGNIYASEALFGAGIHPHRPAKSLTNNELTKLIAAIRKVLNAAIQSGGSTLRDFAGSDSQSGYFQHSFQVYDRADKACTRCKQQLEVESLAGRSTYFCKNCQK